MPVLSKFVKITHAFFCDDEISIPMETPAAEPSIDGLSADQETFSVFLHQLSVIPQE